MSEHDHGGPGEGDHDQTPNEPGPVGRRAYQPKPEAEQTPDDLLTVRIRRVVRDAAERHRDRIDPPVDSLGLPRQQVSIDRFCERLMMAGVQLWASTLPDWTDPLAVPGASEGD